MASSLLRPHAPYRCWTPALCSEAENKRISDFRENDLEAPTPDKDDEFALWC